MVTTKDIAKICNISRGTVDRALNGRSGISEATRRKVLAVAREYGYQPDLLARALVMGRTHSIGIIVFDLLNRYFAQIINSAEQHAREQDYYISIMLSQKQPETERCNISRLAALKADGLLLHPINYSPEFEEELRRHQLPVVTIGNRLSSDWAYVGIDDFAAAREGAELILRRDYDRIVFLCPPVRYAGQANVSAQELRRDGFISAMENSDIPREIWQEQDYCRRVDALMLQGERTAVFCSSDTYVLKLFRHAREKGYDIPGQLGLMGFDNIDTLQYISPRIATIATPIAEVGQQAMALLCGMIERRESPRAIHLAHQIIPGETI